MMPVDPGKLEEERRQFSGRWTAYMIIARMRWFTLILGPVPLLWDGVVWPILEIMGMPAFITMEDLARVLILDVLPLEQYADEFEMLWPHVVRISTLLFVVFVLWTVSARRKAKDAARELASAEDQLVVGGEIIE
jgi:hypothetical protein